MAQEAHETPAGRRGSSTSPSSGMWESPSQMQTYASWNPCAGTLHAAADQTFGTHLSPAAADLRLPSEQVPGHAWNQSTPATGGAHGFLSLLEARNVTPEVFEDVPTAYDYLTGAGVAAAAASNMAGPVTAAYGRASVDRHTGASSVSHVKPEITASPLVHLGDRVVHASNMGCVPCYDHEVKQDNQQREFGAPSMAAFLQQMIPSGVENQSGLGYSGLGSERLMAARSLSADGSFSDYRSTAEIMSSNKQEHNITAEMVSNRSGSGAASVTAKRKSEERAGGSARKSKAASRTSPPKPQAPKVKLGEKITALQQIVSPFGKTDTASVLYETIKYIKFLHEQIQLFSEPYMTKSTYKGRIQFGVEESETTGAEHDLRGRGLCLVPASSTSQVYRDDTLPDCWTPAHRSCLYR